MGQRNGPRPIPSLLEYKTIRLQDRYSALGSDQLERRKPILEQGQKGVLDSNGKPSSASSPQLPPSLASYGGMHSFSQMAQFLPSIGSQNVKRRPSTLLPLTFPGHAGLATGQASEGTESTIKPFYRSSMPEAFLSASSNIINSSSAVPFTDMGNTMGNQYAMKSTLGLECIGKSGLELPKPSSKSEPLCTLKGERLPPIERSHCTVHSTNCSCIHKNRSPDKKQVKKDVKREENPVASRRRGKGGELSGSQSKGSKSFRKPDKKDCPKAKQRQKRETRDEAKKSNSSDQTEQHPSGNLRENKYLYDDEEEGITSYVRRNWNSSTGGSTTFKDEHHNVNLNEEEDEINYFHHNLSILHPPPSSLPPIASNKGNNRGGSLFEDLGKRTDGQDNMGWAIDGFLEDSTLRRAISLRNKMLLYNNSSNNTASETSDGMTPECETFPCKNNEQEVKDFVAEEVGETTDTLEDADESVEVQVRNNHNCKDTKKKLGLPQRIQSVTWQEVSPHLGAKRTKISQKETNVTPKNVSLNPITEQKSQSSIAAEALRCLQKNRKQKTRNHTHCISTVPEMLPEDLSTAKIYIKNLPPIEPKKLAICTIPGQEARIGPKLLSDAATLMTSNYPKFVKMFSLPTSRTRVPSVDQTGKEERFQGQIDGKKVQRRGHLETGSNYDVQQEQSEKPLNKPK
ncbi:uncharacterized protein LOC135155508 [Lytechinus pictus]|uniref:uncharacterized protein LOC135155508 n=1 Tax=Lytechinus pictus TaxID=7653 RepID=UPI0030B9E12D